jgi:hypothetical protein
MDKQKELELIFDMTSHPGWKYLCEDLEQRVDALKEGMITNESTPYQIGLAQGHAKVYREIISLRRLLDHVLTEKEAQVAEDEQAASV